MSFSSAAKTLALLAAVAAAQTVPVRTNQQFLAGVDATAGTVVKPFKSVASAPSGACANAAEWRYLTTTGKLYHCLSGTWTEFVSGSTTLDWSNITGKPTLLEASNNLSDLASAATARTNLGLGAAATQSLAAFLQPSNNLSDLGSAATARTNLGAAPLASPAFTGVPTAPTAATNDNSTTLATTAWVKAQTYLTANQSISVSGDATGSGSTSIALTLANTAVTPGSYTCTGLTVDSKGRITAASNGSCGGGGTPGGTDGQLQINSSGSFAGVTALPAGNFPALTGDVANTAGSLSTTIQAGTVTLAKMANLAGNSIICNNTGTAAIPAACTASQIKTLLAIAASDVSGLAASATTDATNANNISSGTIPLGRLSGITDTQIATANKDGLAATPSLRTLGTGATQAAAGNDSRLSDTRTPTDGTVSTAKIVDGAVTLAKLANQATATLLGNNSGSSGPPLALSASTVKTLLAIAIEDVASLQTSLDNKIDDTEVSTTPGANQIPRADGSGNFTLGSGASRVTLTEGTAPASPSATHHILYVDSSDGHVKRKNSSGTVVDLESTSAGLTEPGTSGLVARTGAGTTAARTIQGASARVSVTNGDGVAGDPTIDIGVIGSSDLSDGSNLPKLNAANTYSAGAKQVFQASGTTAGMGFGGVTADPSGASNGDMWYRSDLNKFRCRENGANSNCMGSGSGGGGGGYSQSFTSQTSVSLTHNLGTKNLTLQCFDGSDNAIQPNAWSIGGTAPYDVAVSFSTAQTGRCVVNGMGRYAAAFSSSTSVSITAANHGFGTCDLNIRVWDNSANPKIVEPDSIECNSTTKDITIAFAASQSGRVLIQ